MLKDFQERCAYSLLHTNETDGMEVDHFNPVLKSKHVHGYDNLMPAFRSCNRNKGDTWPSQRDLKAGLHLIDPTKELDYGHQIFENSDTHVLEGTTPAAIYHIRVMGLNSEYLIERRKVRSDLRELLKNPAMFTGSWTDESTQQCHKCLKTLIDITEKMIPDIPVPPSSASN